MASLSPLIGHEDRHLMSTCSFGTADPEMLASIQPSIQLPYVLRQRRGLDPLGEGAVFQRRSLKSG
jgi:hypothetical protein